MSLVSYSRDVVSELDYYRVMTKVVIYSKPGCHLCDEAKTAIQAAGCEGQFTLEEINIETDPHLLRRYRYEIPVVTFDGTETFRHRVSSEEFKEALQRARLK